MEKAGISMPGGETLIGQIAEATGLPKEMIQGELTRLLQVAGIRPEAATLEDLRAVLAEYVQDVLVAAKTRLTESHS